MDKELLSTDALSVILTTYDIEPPSMLAWRDFLRPTATKNIVVVTDDTSAPLTADSFDAQLLAKPGGMFGTATARRYLADPICGANAFPLETKCSSSVNPGAAYLELAKDTGGRWFPVCASDFRPHFASIASDSVAASACDVGMPVTGGPIDPAKVNVQLTTNPGTDPLSQVSTCTSDGWMFDATQTRIRLCGAPCATARANLAAKVEVTLGCPTTKS